MIIYTEYQISDYKNIKYFIENHPNYSIFQSFEIIDVYKKTINYSPIIIYAKEKDEILGIIFGVLQKEYKGLLGYLTSRCIIIGGPLVKDSDNEIANRLLCALDEKIKRKVIYTQVRNLFYNGVLHESFKKNKYTYNPHLNIIINLDQSFEQLKNSIHKSRIKNYNKALRKGTLVKIVTKVEEVITGYNLLRDTYHKNNIPLPDKSHFLSLFELFHSAGKCRMYSAYYGKIMIGFRILLIYKDIIYDYYAGSARDHSNKYPNDVLIIETLKWGCYSNYNKFDFGGAGNPEKPYGVRDHKMKFCHETIELGRYMRIYNYNLYRAARIGLKIWKVIR